MVLSRDHPECSGFSTIRRNTLLLKPPVSQIYTPFTFLMLLILLLPSVLLIYLTWRQFSLKIGHAFLCINLHSNGWTVLEVYGNNYSIFEVISIEIEIVVCFGCDIFVWCFKIGLRFTDGRNTFKGRPRAHYPSGVHRSKSITPGQPLFHGLCWP